MLAQCQKEKATVPAVAFLRVLRAYAINSPKSRIGDSWAELKCSESIRLLGNPFHFTPPIGQVLLVRGSQVLKARSLSRSVFKLRHR